jgi:hypothetical protein
MISEAALTAQHEHITTLSGDMEYNMIYHNIIKHIMRAAPGLRFLPSPAYDAKERCPRLVSFREWDLARLNVAVGLLSLYINYNIYKL